MPVGRLSDDDVHVEMRDIHKHFGGTRALDGVSIAVPRGEIRGLIGENGAGKSTLMKILAGVIKPDAGEIRIDGQSVSYNAPRDALAQGVTVIAQELLLERSRSVRDNVFLGIEPRRWGVIRKRLLRQRFDALAAHAGFKLNPDARVGSLRVADQQKVEILRALARDARVLIMDEPTAALGPQDAATLFEDVRRLRDAGTTIIYVSHHLDEVLDLCDSVTVLRDGRLVATGPTAEQTPATLVNAMLGAAIEVAVPDRPTPSADAPVVCRVKGLTTAVLRDVSLEIRAGEIVGVAGLIGNGQPELARAIFGADKIHSGTIEIAGEARVIRSPRDAVAAGLAMVPESRKDDGLLLGRSISDNITLPHLATFQRGMVVQRRAERREVDALVEKLGVRTRSAAAAVSSLSGGNQQKVLFAKWLLGEPRLLLVSEPTRGVDVGAKRAIYELMVSLAEEGMAMLLVSSEVEEVLGLANRILVMRNGAIVAELDGPTATEDSILRAAFASEAVAR